MASVFSKGTVNDENGWRIWTSGKGIRPCRIVHVYRFLRVPNVYTWPFACFFFFLYYYYYYVACNSAKPIYIYMCCTILLVSLQQNDRRVQIFFPLYNFPLLSFRGIFSVVLRLHCAVAVQFRPIHRAYERPHSLFGWSESGWRSRRSRWCHRRQNRFGEEWKWWDPVHSDSQRERERGLILSCSPLFIFPLVSVRVCELPQIWPASWTYVRYSAQHIQCDNAGKIIKKKYFKFLFLFLVLYVKFVQMKNSFSLKRYDCSDCWLEVSIIK